MRKIVPVVLIFCLFACKGKEAAVNSKIDSISLLISPVVEKASDQTSPFNADAAIESSKNIFAVYSAIQSYRERRELNNRLDEFKKYLDKIYTEVKEINGKLDVVLQILKNLEYTIRKVVREEALRHAYNELKGTEDTYFSSSGGMQDSERQKLKAYFLDMLDLETNLVKIMGSVQWSEFILETTKRNKRQEAAKALVVDYEKLVGRLKLERDSSFSQLQDTLNLLKSLNNSYFKTNRMSKFIKVLWPPDNNVVNLQFQTLLYKYDASDFGGNTSSTPSISCRLSPTGCPIHPDFAPEQQKVIKIFFDKKNAAIRLTEYLALTDVTILEIRKYIENLKQYYKL
jgi:hypothetical protein